MPILGDSASSFPSTTTSPSAVPSMMPKITLTNNGKPSLIPKFSPNLVHSPRSVPRVTMSPGAVSSAAPSSETHIEDRSNTI